MATFVRLRHAILLGAALAVGACKASPSASLLCSACASDSDCAGNPCYLDATGNHYCGAPCDSCPSGYTCQPVVGSAGNVVQSCFPDTTSCSATMMLMSGADLAGADLSASHADLARSSADLAFSCPVPTGGAVGPTGGTVDRLFFGYTGDTRPAVSTTSYPAALQTVINNIFLQMGKQGVQFALDGGDHMEPNGVGGATAQLANYATATAMLGKRVFMTMGNHECQGQFTTQDCGYAGAETADYRLKAFLSSLSSVSGQTSAYYRFDVMTGSGKAVFLVVADDAWNAAQETWLTAQLTDADATAKYTFVSKHHPNGNTDNANFQHIYDLVTAHKYTLFLNGHSHEYKHPPADHRAVVMGLGGAPFDNPSQMWWGYLTVMQCPDDHIYVTVYDQATGMVQDSFNVPPQ